MCGSVCVCVAAAGSFGARDIDSESSEEGEAKWRSDRSTVSDVLDWRASWGKAGEEEGRSTIRKHTRKTT